MMTMIGYLSIAYNNRIYELRQEKLISFGEKTRELIQVNSPRDDRKTGDSSAAEHQQPAYHATWRTC